MNLGLYICFNFILYCFIGWIIEGLYSLATTKRFKKEGFLKTPFKPMYGIAMTLLIIFHEMFDIYGVPMLLLLILIPTTVEYISGYILDHKFNKKYWDYSKKKYNLNSYICLKFSIYWTALTYIGIYLFQPIIRMIYISSESILSKITLLFLIIFLWDAYITLRTYSKSNVKLQ